MSGSIVDRWLGMTEKFDIEHDQDHLFPRGFWGGKGLVSVPGANETPGQVLYDADGVQRMKVGDNGVVWYMQGAKGDEYISRVEAPESGLTGYWTRCRGEPLEFRRDMVAGGWKCFFTDYRDDRWCKARCVHPSGREVHYEGVLGKQRPTMILTEKGNYQYWHVEGNRVRKSRTFMPSMDGVEADALLVYDYALGGGGMVHRARLVRVELSDGRVRHFEGDSGEERHVKTTHKCGSVQHYAGERGKERLVTQSSSDGTVRHYVGERLKERLWRKDASDGLINLYRGPRFREYLKTAISIHGTTPGRQTHDESKGFATMVVFSGTRGEERKKRRLKSSTGIVEMFEGRAGDMANSEPCLRQVHTNGALMTRETANDDWVVHDVSATAAPAAKRQRVKEKAAALWTELESLAEDDAVKEQALLSLGEHFKALTDAVDKCVA